MADTAAFFAKKKKGGKKKAFKSFNANKIDAAAISSTVHVDAPAISGTSTKATDLPLSTNGLQLESTNGSSNEPTLTPSLLSEKNDDEVWEDASTPIPNRPNTMFTNKNTVAELLDMNALEERRREQDDVVERMRVEETKAALAAARQGMEKEAQRLKQAKNKQEAKNSTSNGISGGESGNKGKWVPVHLRGSSNPALGNSRLMMSKARGKSSIPDTEDAMDFPDLASANAAIEAQKKQEKERQERERQRAASVKSSSGTKTWGVSRPNIDAGPPVRKKLELKSSSKVTKQPVVEPPTPAAPPKPSETETKEQDPASTTPAPAKPAPLPIPVPAPTPVPETTTTTTPAPALKKKKKKKKDLSTFKK